MPTTGTLNPRLAAQLNRTPEIAVKAAAMAMEEGANEIVAFMKANAPRGETGDLADSIAWTWGDAPAGSLVIDEIRTGPRQGLQYATLRIIFYVGVWYAHFPEFGTQPHSLAPNASVDRGLRQGEGGDHPGTIAQPYFFPSWRAMRAKFKRKIRTAVRLAIREAINA